MFSQVLEAFAKAEKKRKPNPELMFDDVYDKLPKHLEKQKKEMVEHVMQNKEHYPMDSFKPMNTKW